MDVHSLLVLSGVRSTLTGGPPIDWSLRISAVSYLNTWPLVWGFLDGPQHGLYDFRFDLPAQCADAVGAGEADLGLVPCAELDRLGLDFLPDLGIACDGPVRSILLISRRPSRRSALWRPIPVRERP